VSSPKRNRLLGLVVAAAVFALDQLVKWIVTGPLQLTREGDRITVTEFFNVNLSYNIGVSLSMLPATSPAMRWALVGLTSAIALVVLVWLLRERKLADIAPLGLILGGALGNILDRVQYGHVIDYADLHFGAWRPFLIFNVADAAISIGVVIILARALFMREKPAAAQEGPDGPDLPGQSAENSTNA